MDNILISRVPGTDGHERVKRVCINMLTLLKLFKLTIKAVILFSITIISIDFMFVPYWIISPVIFLSKLTV